MSRTARLKEITEKFLEEYIQEVYKDDDSGVKKELIYDCIRHHYQLMRIGWDEKRFHYSNVFHFQIWNDKIWVLNNETEELIGDILVEKGIQKSEIVFAFHNPKVRHFTEFAVS